MTTQTTSQFWVRPARMDDLDPCLALNASLETQNIWQMQRREESDFIGVNFQTLRLPRPLRVEYPRLPVELRLDLTSLAGVLVAEAREVVLGYIQVVIVAADKNAWARNVVVDERWRRHGIGTALVSQGKAWAKLNGANHFMIETTLRSYPAIQFCLKQGFIFCGFNDRYYTSQDIAVFFGQNL